MPRNSVDVAKELQAVGSTASEKNLLIIAEQLDEGECISEGVVGLRWFPDSGSNLATWLLMTSEHLICISVDGGGWFSKPSARKVSRFPYSDIREVSSEYTNGKEMVHQQAAHNVILRTRAVEEQISVPIKWCPEANVRRFMESVRQRYQRSGKPTNAGRKPFSEELRLLSDFKASGQLSDEEVAQAIRKLMAT